MTIPTMNAVQSSMLQSVGHDYITNQLFVRFNNGKLYCYDGVLAHEYQQMLASDSVGRYLNANIKPNYQATLVVE